MASQPTSTTQPQKDYELSGLDTTHWPVKLINQSH